MPLRHAVLLVVAVVGLHSRGIWEVANNRAESRGRVSRAEGASVILVVSDGLRWQEVFRGADSLLMFGDARVLGGDAASAHRKYWRPTARQRREALMPFFWSTVAREGQIFGNRDAGSAAVVTNPMKFSYPGYNEMLVGWPDPHIDRNTFGPNPNVTVFEWMGNAAAFRGRVGVFGMWDVFEDIFNARRSGLPVRHHDTDAATHAEALRHLRTQAPRALFVGFGATDDLAHKRRYDLTLDAAHAVDSYLRELWTAVQGSPRYRGRTTLIVVADHGRGRTPRDWMDHGDKVPGAEETWIAVIGPNTPALGELHDAAPVTLAQTAATVAWAVGLDYARAVPRAAPPVRAATAVALRSSR